MKIKRPARIETIDNVECMIITLTKGYEAIVNMIDADLAEFNWSTAGGSKLATYASRHITQSKKRKIIYMHRTILRRALGVLFLDDSKVCDHKNRNSMDNRRNNLRLVTQSQNCANSISNVNMKGAYFHKNDLSWYSRIVANGKNIYLGTFRTEQEAHEAYCKAAHKHFGEFARTE